MAEVEVRGLSTAFGRVTAVRGMSFTAPAGTVAGFLGPTGSNGAGALALAGYAIAFAAAAMVTTLRRDVT